MRSRVLRWPARAPAPVLAALLLAALLLAGCGPAEGFSMGGTPEVADPEYVRTPPPLLLAEYTGENVITGGTEVNGAAAGAEIDLSNLDRGYVGVKATGPTSMRVYVIKGSDQTGSPTAVFYPQANDGSPNFYSLSQGSGDYYFIVMAEVTDAATGALQGIRVAEGWGSARLVSEFAPFLINNREVDYGADSTAVAFSYELAAHCATNLEVAQQVYSWIAANVEYDTPKSQAVGGASGVTYLPDPDETLATKKGICYDYASLAAAMLRANGIPCQLIKGDALADETTGEWIYHAWNMIWLEETGWVAVSVPTKPGDWFRIDLTFAATGGYNVAKQINNDANYTPTEVS